MSEARQSIEAARDSGADQLAPRAITNADKLLSDAEDNIRQGDYGKAQQDAVAAREAARQARVISEVRQTHQSPPAPEPPPAAPKPVDPPPALAPPPAPPAPANNDAYTVAPGDSLWRIAARPDIYGNPLLWPLLLKANAQSVKDADLIHPGNKLRIESKPSASDQHTAVRHAQHRGGWALGNAETADGDYLRRYGLR